MDRSVPCDTRAAYDALAPVYDGLTAHHDHERWLALLLGSRERPRPGRPAAARRGLRHRQELHAAGAARLRRDRLRHLAAHGCARPPAARGPRRASARGGHAAPAAAVRGRRPRHLPRRRRQLPARRRRAARRAVRDAAQPAPGRAAAVRRQHPRHLSRRLLRRPQLASARTPTRRSASRAPSARGGLFATTLRAQRGAELLAESRHVQRHHPARELERALAAAGMEPLAVYGSGADGLPVRPPDEERHTKLVVVARRPPVSRQRERR